MSEPDIIDNITTDGSIQAWVWVDAFEVTRQGSKPLPPEYGLTDKWRISIPVRASLARDGEVVLDAHGNEIPTASTRPSVSVDVADIIHDPRVAQALGLIRAVALDLVRGTLVPKPQEPTP